ncbi:MAG: DUF1045 domain-containing protein [Pseudomonadota bacterium]
MQGLNVTRLGSFLALVPTGDTSALSTFAAQVVMSLDAFRKPMSDPELTRRRKAKLTAAQEHHLRAWGYHTSWISSGFTSR